jgi:hypothetical protein
LLHNFHYPETVKAFQAVIKDDPDCAIAYWGLAMSAMPNPLVPPFPPAVIKTAQEAIQQGKAAKTQSPREAEYLAAIDTFFEDYDNTAYRPRAGGSRRAGSVRSAARYLGNGRRGRRGSSDRALGCRVSGPARNVGGSGRARSPAPS